MGEMTSAEIGSIRDRGVVLVVESRRAITISTRMSLATGVIVGEILGDSDGTTTVNRLGEEAGVLVIEIRPEDEDVHTVHNVHLFLLLLPRISSYLSFSPPLFIHPLYPTYHYPLSFFYPFFPKHLITRSQSFVITPTARVIRRAGRAR
jgi:hypothetical protein